MIHTQVLRRFMSQLNKVGLSLIKNLGVVGGTAKVLSALSTGVASLAGDARYVYIGCVWG